MMIDPADYPDWDSLVIRFPNHTVFHSAAWAKVLHESYNFVPRYFTIIKNNKLSAALPLMEITSPFTGKRGVSLPFTDSVPSLTRDAGNAEHLFQEAVYYGQKAGWKYVELRDAGKFPEGQKLFDRYCTHDLDLSPGEQKLYNSLRNSTRRNIQKAQKQGVRIHISGSADCLKEFCRLNCITRKKHGVPPQPDKFFQKIHDHLFSKDQGFVALAMYQKKPIAGAVYLHFGQSALFKYGASDPDYLFLRPNNLVMWEAIQWYARRGFRTMSFGRTDPENEGLLRFKRGWNPVESQLGYVRYNLHTRTFETSEQGPKNAWKVFSKMPVPLLKLLGRVLYKHAG